MAPENNPGLNNFFQHVPLPMWIYHPGNFRFLDVNEAAVRHYGYSREEFLSMTVVSIRPAEEVSRPEAVVRQLDGLHSLYHQGYYKHRKKNGEIIDVEISSEIIYQGEEKCHLVLANDITAQRAHTREITKNAERFAALSEFNRRLLKPEDWEKRLHAAFGELGRAMDVDAVFYYEFIAEQYDQPPVVRSFEEWLREPEKTGTIEDQPRTFSMEGLWPLLEPLTQGDMLEVYTDDLPGNAIKNRLKQQGVLSFLAMPIFTNGDLHGLIGFDDRQKSRKWTSDERHFLTSVRDSLSILIERGLAQEAAAQSEQRLKSTINNIPGITYRCLSDKDWTMLFISDEIERLTGYPSTDFIHNSARSYASIMHPDDAVKVHDLETSLLEKGLFFFKYRIISADGRVIWVEDRGSGTYNKEGALLWIDGVILDVTDAVQKGVELKNSLDRIKSQNERLREIAWIQSHVVRAPLARIMALAGLMERKLFSPEMDSPAILANIVSSAKELDIIIREITRKSDELSVRISHEET